MYGCIDLLSIGAVHFFDLLDDAGIVIVVPFG
jgi:hypothetical protein